MEVIHYVVGVLSIIGSAFLYHQRLREQLITQRIDMMDKFNREHADNCFNGLKEISKKLDDLKANISEHNAEYSAVKVEVENIKNKVDRLEAWFGKIIEK